MVAPFEEELRRTSEKLSENRGPLHLKISVGDASNLSESVGILTKLARFPPIWRDLINLAGFRDLSVFSQSLGFSRSCQDMEKQHRSEKPLYPQ
jgi:hypothetical protein